MRKYVNWEEVEEALFAKREKERQHWIEYLKQYRATKEYSSKEQAVDNWLRGYGEAVEDFLAIMENTPAAEVVPVVTETNVGGKWIPVTERLPIKGTNVLIYSKSGGRAEGELSEDGWCQYRWCCPQKDVTHWMPLPEPPETEKGGE